MSGVRKRESGGLCSGRGGFVTATDVLSRMDSEQKSAGSNLYFIRWFLLPLRNRSGGEGVEVIRPVEKPLLLLRPV